MPICFLLGTHPSPPAPLHPLLFCNRLPLLRTPIPFLVSISIVYVGLSDLSYFLIILIEAPLFVFRTHHAFIWVHLLFIDIHRYLYMLLLGTHCGGRRCALSPLHPPTRSFEFEFSAGRSWKKVASLSSNSNNSRIICFGGAVRV